MPEIDRDKLALIRKNPANLRYFFEHLNDPAWIDVLEAEDFFKAPLEPERTEDEDGAWVRFPTWPASAYLARVASADPERVARVLLSLPATDNVRVHLDVIEAARQMSPQLAEELADRELAWFRDSPGPLLNYPSGLIELGLFLFQDGREQRADDIFRAVLELSADEQSLVSRRRVGSRLAEWEYGKALEKVASALLERDSANGLTFLADLLEQAVEFGMRERDGTDYSYVWRPAIEDHTQNLGHSIFDRLVEVTRDFAVMAAATETGLEEVLAVLDSHQAPIFKRIGLHVLRQTGDLAPERVAADLLDPANEDSVQLWHEYSLLLGDRFGSLGPEHKAALVGLINRPDPADQDEQGRARHDYRRLKRLAMIDSHLAGAERADYDSLLARFGPPDHPDFVAYSRSWVGPTSPLNTDEIRERSVTELLEFLRTWEPPTTLEPAPTPEGLKRLLAQVVGENPEPYAAAARDFAKLGEPAYVRALLDGLAEAAKAGRVFDWRPVLELGEWVLEQPVEDDEPELDLERDPGWRWTRKAIADLLGAALEAKGAHVGIEHRDGVWRLLERLAEDPDPRDDADEQDDEETRIDYATRSLNVTRGEAMHAVVRYVMWVERELGESFTGLDSAPEAREVLERHLDPQADPSPAVRAVYGMWLAQLVRMDREWVMQQAAKMFPVSSEEAVLFAAAWQAYVVFTRPWLDVLSAVGDAYATAIERLETQKQGSAFTDRPDEKLGEHLAWYAIMGAIPIDEPGLWQSYWLKADPELRRNQVEQLGRMLEGDRDVPDDVVQRVKGLWGWIDAHAGERAERSQVLAPFGWLLRAEALDGGWLLTHALALLEQGIHLEADYAVCEALVRLVDAYPSESAGVIKMMIQTEPEPWSLAGSDDEVRTVLARALHSGDGGAERRARDALNLLAARGRVADFRDLIDSAAD